RSPYIRIARAICRAANLCSFHPGDINHWMSNTFRGRDLDRRFYVSGGNDSLFALAYLPLGDDQPTFELMIDPDHRGGPFERDMLLDCESAFWRTLNQSHIVTNVFNTDSLRDHTLVGLGYFADAEPFQCLNTRPLAGPLPSASLPDGFAIRNVEGEHEADAVRTAHDHAFRPNWSADEYRAVMRTPDFDPHRELVVVAPDGRAAAFLVYWLDPISKSGLFEPIGCHREFQRRGLTKALMVEGLRRMIDAGMETAIISHQVGNAASMALYASVGFKARCTVRSYSKARSS
ncbi:MAG TPA: GNAT family N-acetyltransferase, partial [Aggregatilineales bacterium]|nr:GNAT family N-acetyltransferase [Aggregatilineales bacterium]